MADILSQKTPFDKLFQKAGEQYGVDPSILKSMAFVESSFNPEAIGPTTKYGRAQGLMQFLPATARAYKLRNPFDPNQAIPAAARYMKDLINQFDGDVTKALEAYNGGPRLVGRSKQTKDYAQKVMNYARGPRSDTQEPGITDQPLIAAQAPTMAQEPRTTDQGQQEGRQAVLESAQLALQALPNYSAALNLFMQQDQGDTEEEYNQYEAALGPELASAVSDYTPQQMAHGGYVHKYAKGDEVRVPSRSEVPQLDASGRVDTTPVVPGPPEKEFSALDYLLGAADVGSTMIKGAVVEPYALYRGLYEQAKSNEPRTSRRIAEAKAEEIRQAARVAPRTEAGGKLLQDISKMAEEAKIPPIIPQLLGVAPLQRGSVGQGAVLATEEAVLPVMRKITGNADLTPGEVYGAMAAPRETLKAGAPAIIKPPGGVVSLSDEMRKSLDVAGNNAMGLIIRELGNTPENIELARAVGKMFLEKAPKYFETQAGSVSDPLRQLLVSGKISMTKGSELEKLFPKYLTDAARQGKESAIRDLEERYNRMFRMTAYGREQRRGEKSPVEGYNTSEELQEDVIKQTLSSMRNNPDIIPDYMLSQIFPPKYDAEGKLKFTPADIRQKMKDNPNFFADRIEPKLEDLFEGLKATAITQSDITTYPNLSKELVEAMRQSPAAVKAFSGKEPIYSFDTSSYLGQRFFQMADPTALSSFTAKEVEQMSFPEFARKLAEKKQQAAAFDSSIDTLVKNLKAGRKIDPQVATYGTEPYLKTEGFEWRKVTNPDATKMYGQAMNNSIAGYSRSGTYGATQNGRQSLLSGEVEVYALHAPDGTPLVNMDVKVGKDGRREINQVTGNGPLTGNVDPDDYFPQIRAFADSFGMTKSDVPYNVKQIFNEGYSNPKFASGGIVDKPLYDRA